MRMHVRTLKKKQEACVVHQIQILQVNLQFITCLLNSKIYKTKFKHLPIRTGFYFAVLICYSILTSGSSFKVVGLISVMLALSGKVKLQSNVALFYVYYRNRKRREILNLHTDPVASKANIFLRAIRLPERIVALLL